MTTTTTTMVMAMAMSRQAVLQTNTHVSSNDGDDRAHATINQLNKN